MTDPRARFERYEAPRHARRAEVFRRGPDDAYLDPGIAARWKFWQAAQPAPPKLNLGTSRAYLAKLAHRAVFSTERTAILRAAQHLMRCVRNDNPELF